MRAKARNRRNISGFSYSDGQWREIGVAIKAGGGRALSEREREILKSIGQRYQGHDRNLNSSNFQPRRKIASEWEKVRKLALKLSQEIRSAQAMPKRDPPDPFFDNHYLEEYGQLFGDGRGMTLQDLLEKYAEHAAQTAILLRSKVTRISARYGRREPAWHRLRYYRQVLAVWTNAGGRLAYSRSSSGSRKLGNVVGGPTVKYLRAVTGPVMGATAPKPEGLATIINREKS